MKYLTILLILGLSGCFNAQKTTPVDQTEKTDVPKRSNTENFETNKNKKTTQTKADTSKTDTSKTNKKTKTDTKVSENTPDTSKTKNKRATKNNTNTSNFNNNNNKRKTFNDDKIKTLNIKELPAALKTEVQSLSLSQNCRYLVAGGIKRDLAVFDLKKNKVIWKQPKLTCLRGRCKESVFVGFMPHAKTYFAALDGDTVREITKHGYIKEFRGGFLKEIRQFILFDSSKKIAALYPHGLAIWHTGGGLIRKLPFKNALDFTVFNKNNFAVIYKDKIVVYDFKGKKISEYKTAGILGITAISNNLMLVYKDRIEIKDKSMKEITSLKFPDDTKIVAVPKNQPFLVMYYLNKYYLFNSKQTFASFKLKKYPAATLKIDANDKCIAVAVKNHIFFAKLK